MRAVGQTGQPRLLPMRNLLRHEHGHEVAIGPGLALRALHQVAPHPTAVGQGQAFEEGIELEMAAPVIVRTTRSGH